MKYRRNLLVISGENEEMRREGIFEEKQINENSAKAAENTIEINIRRSKKTSKPKAKIN